jgi:hypothetical protein
MVATAVAAEPDKGTVSSEAPKVTWKGEVTGSFFALLGLAAASDAGNPQAAPCELGCDTFTLTVATKADLTIGADSPGEAADGPDSVVLRVKKPDGSTVSTFGDSNKGKPLTVKFKGAATGEYVIDYANNYGDVSEYDAFAEIPAAPKAEAPPEQGETANTPPPPSPSPVPAGQGQGTPPQPATAPSQPNQAENIDLRIAAGKVSARKLKKSRKLQATVSVSRDVAKLTGFLRKGSKTIAKSRRGTTRGTVRVTLKLSKQAARKVRKGPYALTFVADDGKGTTASKTVKVKIRK